AKRHALAIPNQYPRTIFVLCPSCTLLRLAPFRAPVDRARKHFEPRRNPNLFLYWRSRRDLPTGHRSRPFHRGTSPRQALAKDIWAQELLGCSRRIGSARKIASVRPSPPRAGPAPFAWPPPPALPPPPPP